MDTVESDGGQIIAAGRFVANPGERFRRDTSFRLEARMPALVRLVFAGIDLVVAPCPVDEDMTWVAARYYRPRVGHGRLARVTSWLGAQVDWQTAQTAASSRPSLPKSGPRMPTSPCLPTSRSRCGIDTALSRFQRLNRQEYGHRLRKGAR